MQGGVLRSEVSGCLQLACDSLTEKELCVCVRVIVCIEKREGEERGGKC